MIILIIMIVMGDDNDNNHNASDIANVGACRPERSAALRPISLLRISLLRFVDSIFPGNPLWTCEFHPLEFRFCLSQPPEHPES